MRIVVIVAALIVGLVGLGMSICGGAFLLNSHVDSLQGAWFLLLPLGSIAAGVSLIWICLKMID